MKSLLLKADLLSPEHTVTFRNKSKMKSCCGLVTSILLAIFCGIVFFFLSRDLFVREAPISRSVSEPVEDSTIFLKDFPIPLTFVAGTIFTNDSIFEDLEVRVSFIQVDSSLPSLVNVHRLKLERCRDEFFENAPEFKEIEFLKNSFCINPFEIFDLQGNLVEGKPFIAKERTDDKSASITVIVKKKEHLTDEMFEQKYRSLSLTSTLGLRHVNVENFSDPIKFRSYGVTNVIDNKLVKVTLINVAKQSLRTDSGIVFSDFSAEEFYTFDKVNSEYSLPSNDGIISRINISSSNFAAVQTRQYVKLQTVLAQISGVAKIGLILAKFIVSLFAKHSFYVKNIQRAASITKRIEIRDGDCSVEQISHNNKADSVLKNKSVSVWAFLFMRKQQFEKQFLSTSILNRFFDVELINRKLYRIENKLENLHERRGVRSINVNR